MRLILALAFLLFSFSAGARDLKPTPKLTPFQANIKNCLKDKLEVKDLKTLEQLYKSLNKRFPLRRSETLYREVEFRDKAETKKLKLQKGQISLYKILPDKTVVLINNDARQNGLTEESAINQLLVHADVQSDWLQVKESRAELSILTLSRRQNQLSALVFESEGQVQKLECSSKDLADICVCRS